MRVVGFILTLLILLAVGWTGLWFYAAHETERQLDAWFRQEVAEGRRWTCPGRDIAGFPLAIEVICTQPRFAGSLLGGQASGSLGTVHVRAAVTDPRRAIVTLGSPFAFRDAEGANDFTVTWSTMALDLIGLPAAIHTIVLDGADIAVKGRFGDGSAQSGGAAKGSVTLAKVPSAPDPTVDFTIAIGGAAIPALDDLLGGSDPSNLDFTGRLTQAVFNPDARSLPALVESWRMAGGAIGFSAARLARGQSLAEASGPLYLDDVHRVSGKLDASFTGLAPILRRYGINPNLATAGSILNSLFGKPRAPSGKPAGDPNAIQLPILFRDGRVGIGPVTLPLELSPLY